MVRCKKQMPRPLCHQTIQGRAIRLRTSCFGGQVSLIIPTPPKAGKHHSRMQEKGFAQDLVIKNRSLPPPHPRQRAVFVSCIVEIYKTNMG